MDIQWNRSSRYPSINHNIKKDGTPKIESTIFTFKLNFKSKTMTHHFITIESNIIGLTFGLPHLKMLQNKVEIFPEIYDGGALTSAGFAYILYYSYKNYCMIKELKPSHDFEFFMNFIEDAQSNQEKANELLLTIDAWNQSRFIKKDKIEVEDDKKKLTTRKKTVKN